MFSLCHRITIAGKRYSAIVSCQVKRNITTLTGTAKIVVPSTAVLKQTDGSRLNVLTAQQVKRGDAVKIELGYNEKYYTEFSGYVNRVNLTQPLEIECIDASFLLQQSSIKKAYKETTLQAVLNDIVEGTSIKVSTGDLKLNINKLILTTKAGGSVTRDTALNDILSRYGLVGYFDTSGGLFVGLRYGKRLTTVNYDLVGLKCNVLKDDDLKYHNADEQKVKIKAIHIDKLGERTEVEVGDSLDGATRTIFLTDVKDKTQLKQLAENELQKYKYDGYSGKISAFLQPFCEPGCVISLRDEKYNQRGGSYYCEGIEVDFNTSGGRRKVDIGAKL